MDGWILNLQKKVNPYKMKPKCSFQFSDVELVLGTIGIKINQD